MRHSLGKVSCQGKRPNTMPPELSGNRKNSLLVPRRSGENGSPQFELVFLVSTSDLLISRVFVFHVTPPNLHVSEEPR